MGNFFDVCSQVLSDLLQKFILPIGISYWDFIISMGFAAIVIVALVNKLPISMAGRSMAENAKRKRSDKD